MQIKEMFEKNIERQIKGVIKVGQKDDSNIYQELNEYVVTREIRQHMAKFYNNYQKGIDGNTDKMGVWISGFFGSGKSHFLKILSYLLENKDIQDKKAVNYLDEQIQDNLLFSEMKRISNTPTEVILFNIDSKSEINGKSKEDAILKVFKKVFNEHRGFYGGNFGIADMEIYLTNEGVYDTFKEEFKKIKGDDWENRRRTFRFDADAVIGALTKATGMTEETAREWFKNGSNKYELSIEGFSKEVKEYIDSKGENFHLIFLVDEVGQYIGDNTKLMVNLQTMTEDLGTACNGKAWVMVTAQESIDEMSKNIKGDDFSKIQGRFDTRLSLSSISVDEVIQKRILDKKDFARKKLEQIYFEKSAILNNLITFKEATADFKNYSDEKEFAQVYPFIPYQFKLLQNVFEQVRKHGSSGKHLSEGERSMLSAFKESVLSIKDKEEGALVPFHAFYETIKEFLNPAILRVIDNAYNNPKLKNDKLNINVLKVLFMIKYIKEMDANIDNIATLMVTHIDEDKLQLKQEIAKTLDLLIGETLIQKNGESYIFLTDDEQDINREIKQIHPEEGILKKELRESVFGEFYDDKKYRYSKQYDFNFNRNMDEKSFGNQTANIGINVLSHLSDYHDSGDSKLMFLSASKDEVVVRLSENYNYLDELEEAIKIEEYSKRKNVSRMSESIQNIINAKRAESRIRKKRAKEALREALKDATFYINGEKVNILGSSVKEKINNALKVQIQTVYTKLAYIDEFINGPEDLGYLLKDEQQTDFIDGEKERNSFAVKEVLEYINMQDNINKQIRVKLIIDRFTDKPYGWNSVDVSGVIAILLKNQKIKLRYKNENVDINTKGIITLLTKPSETDSVIVIKRVKVDAKLINIVKNICRELWNKSDIASDEDELAKNLKNLIFEQIAEIKSYIIKYENHKYPGKSLLDKGLEYFEQLNDIFDNVGLFNKLKEMEEDLLIWEEDVAYVKSFFENQKHIYDDGIKAYKMYKENKFYLDNGSIKYAYECLSKIMENAVPYGKIKNIPEYVNEIEIGIANIAIGKREELFKQIKEDIDYLVLLAKGYERANSIVNSVKIELEELKEKAELYKDIIKIEGLKSQRSHIRKKYETLIQKEIQEIIKEERKNGEISKPVKPITQEVKHIRMKELVFVKTIKTEEEVDILINEIGKKLKQAIRENKNIEFI